MRICIPRTSGLIFSVLASVLMMTRQSNASIDFSPHIGVEFKSVNGAGAIAFPALGDCRTWHYVPSGLYGRGSLTHEVNHVKVNGGSGIGLVNSFEFEAHPGLNREDIEEFKKLIFNRAMNSRYCLSSEEDAGMPDGQRATSIIRPRNLNDILLRSAQVKVEGSLFDSVGQREPKFFKMVPTFSAANAWDLASKSRSLTLYNDASEDGAYDRALNKLLDRNSKIVGRVLFSMDGVLASVDAWLELKSDMKLKFVSFLKKECSEVTKRGDQGAMMLGYAAAGIPGAVVGAMVEQKTKRCLESLATFFAGGEISGIFRTNVGEIDEKDTDGNAILIETCNDKGQCGNPVPLQSYIKAELLYGFLNFGFLDIVNRAIEQSFAHEVGKSEIIHTKVNFRTISKRALHGRRVFSVDVRADGLNLSSVSSKSGGELLSCARRLYPMQLSTPSLNDLIGNSPLPIHPSCLQGN